MAALVERYRIWLAAALAATLVLGSVLLYQRWREEAELVEVVLPAPTADAAIIKVYVTGSVAQPGVYALRKGDRVEDAVQAAGGALPQADLGRLNLAVLLRDEMQVHLPGQGEPSATVAGERPRINVNTATVELLDTLPGIGKVRATDIVAYRTKNGPFRSTAELRDRRLVPAAIYEQIKDLISVD